VVIYVHHFDYNYGLRKMDTKRTFKAVIVSPWASLIFLLYLFIEQLIAQGLSLFENIFSQLIGTLFILIMFILGFVGTSYFIVFLVGIPTHWILSKFKIKHWAAYTVSGLFIGLTWHFISTLGSNMPTQLQYSGYLPYAVNSVIISYVFWYITVGESKNNN
jgi:hypothetical protein